MTKTVKPDLPVAKRSEVGHEWGFTVQTQQSAGNWTDELNTNDYRMAQDHAKYKARISGRPVRVVDNYN
jgi:hypothetical protein